MGAAVQNAYEANLAPVISCPQDCSQPMDGAFGFALCWLSVRDISS
jgi:hypothetical protein